jgi:predicted nucleic acid-binding protein
MNESWPNWVRDTRRKKSVDWLGAIRQSGRPCFPAPLPTSTADPDDEKFVECAVSAQADYLVTGDKSHLLVLEQVRDVSIVSASAFLRFLGLPENAA